MENQPAGTGVPKPRFSLGQLVATPNAINSIPNDEILVALSQHIRGDWGTLDQEDWQANDEAMLHGGRLLSAYFSKQNIKFWIITEADHVILGRATTERPKDFSSLRELGYFYA